MNAFINKLQSNHGDSIAEVLVGVLITALAALAFSTMVSSSIHIISNSSKTINEYYRTISADTSNVNNGTLTIRKDTTVMEVNGKTSFDIKIYGDDDSVKFYIGGDSQ